MLRYGAFLRCVVTLGLVCRLCHTSPLTWDPVDPSGREGVNLESHPGDQDGGKAVPQGQNFGEPGLSDLPADRPGYPRHALQLIRQIILDLKLTPEDLALVIRSLRNPDLLSVEGSMDIATGDSLLRRLAEHLGQVQRYRGQLYPWMAELGGARMRRGKPARTNRASATKPIDPTLFMMGIGK